MKKLFARPSGLFLLALLALAICGCRQLDSSPKPTPQPTDWTGAKWISGPMNYKPEGAAYNDVIPAPLVFRDFSVRKGLESATLQIAGLGYYDLFVNGNRLTDTAFPLWTPYRKRVLFDLYDLTDRIKAGDNSIEVELGNGWWNPLPMRMWGRFNLRSVLEVGQPCVIAKLTLAYRDGTTETVATDTQWKSGKSQCLINSHYIGETFDNRIRSRRQDAVNAVAVSGPSGKLLPREAPPITVRDHWQAHKINSIGKNTYVVDFGVNFGGMAVFKFRNPKGKIKIRYGELVKPDGTVNVMTGVAGQIKRAGMGGPGSPDIAEQSDTFIANGDAEETFEPRFAFHSFRYAQIEGEFDVPKPEDFTALATASAVADASVFECDSEYYNELHAVCRRTFLSNLQGVQSDCPAREKFGYGADIAATVDALCRSFDMREFYRKTVRDFLDESEDDGWFTETAPYVGIGDSGYSQRGGPIGWTVGVPVMLDALVRYYGDLEIVSEAYPALTRYIGLVREKFPNLIIPHCIGDHEALDKAAADLTATAHFHQWATLTAKFAGLLGKPDEAHDYIRLATAIAAKFNEKFVKNGIVGNGSQGAQAFAIYHGLVDTNPNGPAYRQFLKAIADRGNAVSTGIFGTKYMLDILGGSELAGEIVNHDAFPGWKNMLNHGATTLWENWAGSDNTFSQNHPMFGSVEDWLHCNILGIRIDPDAIGCNKVTIDPQPLGCTKASGSYRTPRGEIRVKWKLLPDGTLKVDKQLPPGITEVK